MKPLGRKAYGHIGHLPGSRMGPGDHHVHEGQGRICTETVRDKHDRVIIQEKLDGTNVAVAKIDGKVVALIRSGYTATSSPYEQHHLWAAYVREHAEKFDALLSDGERVCCEWLAQAHGSRYDLTRRQPFVAFDIMREDKRLPFRSLWTRCVELGELLGEPFFNTPVTIDGRGFGPLPPLDAMAMLGTYGGHGALDPIEGVVYRVERHPPNAPATVDFLAKWVRPDKVDGCYLPARGSNDGAVWNWRPSNGPQ